MCRLSDPQLIIATVSEALSLPDIKKRTKKPEYAYARFIAIKLLRDHTTLSYDQIANLFDLHITAIYWAERKIKVLIKNNHEVLAKWEKVKKAIEIL